MLLALFLQMVNIVNIMPTRGNTNSLSPFQVMLGRNAKMEDTCPHKPLETVLVSKNNDITNRTGNQNMIEAVFLYASNIHVTSKQKTEFTFLIIDTLKKITRGAQCRPTTHNKDQQADQCSKFTIILPVVSEDQGEKETRKA